MIVRRALCLLLLLTACGGSDSAAPSPPIPPPPAPTPASVAISAGDGQTAEPGTAVVTVPAVVVRSSSGAGVANVAVTFAVDSGGGTITASSATTDASGIATPGGWRLGASEGPQVLVATVPGLTPVRIRAVSRVPTVTIATGTIATGGGTITVSRPGLLTGTTLILPAGAVTGAVTVSMSLISTAGVTLRRGMTPIGPGLRITSSVGRLARPARVHVSTGTRPDANAVLLAYNTRTGAYTMPPQQITDATGISALLPALDASIIEVPVTGAVTSVSSAVLGAAPLRVSTSTATEEELALIIVELPPESQNRDYDSGFRVQRDNWDFTNFPVAWLPFIVGDESPVDRVANTANGMVATSLWYFKTQRGAQPLYKRFRLQADQPRSNKVGIRWAALAWDSSNVLYRTNLAGVDSIFGRQAANVFASTNLKLLRLSFYMSDDRPVPVLMYDLATIAEIADTTITMADPMIGIATRVTGNTFEVVVPENDEFSYTIEVTDAGGLQPVTITTLGGRQFTVRSFIPILARPLLDQPAVAGNYSKVLAGTVGDTEGWPVPELHWEKGKLDEEKVFVADSLQIFWECPACPTFGVRLPDAPATAKKPQGFQSGKISGGTMQALGRLLLSAQTWKAVSPFSDTVPTRTGNNIQLVQELLPEGSVSGWLDWRTVSYRKVDLRAAPDSVGFSRDTSITVTLSPSQPLPAGTTFSWILRTDAGRDSVASTAPTHTRNLKVGQNGTLLIIAHEKDTRRPIARDSIRVKPDEPAPFWRITSITDPDGLTDFEDTSGGDPINDIVTRLLAQPARGLVALENQAGGNTVLRLRVLSTNTWTTANCCPPSAAPFPGELRQTLGEMPSTTFSVGPFFSAYNRTQWSQSTTNLGEGTLTGTYVDGGLVSRPIEDLGIQVGPVNFYSITATRTDTVMTGTITVRSWVVDSEQGFVRKDEDLAFRLPFTAVRIR